MKVKISTHHQQGRLLPQAARNEAPRAVGDLRIQEMRDPSLGRAIVCARLLNLTNGIETDVLPELNDARLIWADGKKMRFTGVERIGEANYAQTWSVELLNNA